MSQHFVINAGRKKIGDVGYDNYVGQIKPADMAKIIWFGVGGDDTTGDGSLANPYLTFARGTDDLSATKIYVLNIDLGGTREMSSLIYWNPATGNDANTGLTPAQAVQSYAVAKAKAILNGKTRIEALTTFTATDGFDFDVQGEIGETLTYNGTGSVQTNYALYNTQGLPAEAVAFGAGKFVAVVIRSFGTDPHFVYSSDGQTWTAGSVLSNTSGAFSCCFGTPGGNPLFLIVARDTSTGQGVVWSSPDGVNFSVSAFIGANYNLFVPAWDGSQFILTGRDGNAGNAAVLYTSPDGVTWTQQTIPAWAGAPLIRIAYGGGLWVGAVYNNIMTSPDGVTWTDRTGLWPATAGQVNAIAYGNGEFIITLNNGDYIYSSTPTTAWNVTAAAFVSANAIGYSATLGVFVVADANGANTDFYYLDSGHALTLVQTFAGAGGLLAQSGVAIGQVGIDEVLTMVGTGITSAITSALVVYSNRSLTNAVYDVSKNPRLFPSVQVANVTSIPTTGRGLFLRSGNNALNCRIESADDIAVEAVSNLLTISKSILKSPTTAFQITGTAAAQDDIKVLRNTIAGNFSLLNTGGTNKELIQDNIITGDAVATAVTDMKSGDVLGAVSNFNLLPSVAEIDPLFIDSVEYKIQRELLGAIFDSYMIQRSAFYINGNGDAADWGAWSSFAINIQYIFTRSFNFLLPSKPDTVAQVKHNRANLKVSENGTPDVVNTPTGRWEEIVLSYGALPQLADYLANHIEFVDWMESLIDMTCEIAMDANYAPATTVTASAASAIDDPFIDIVAANIRSGDRIVVASKEYSVIYVINGTRLVLSEPLKSAVSISQSIRVKSPVGYGEYQYVPQQERKLSQWMFNRKDYIRGLQLRFVRKWQ